MNGNSTYKLRAVLKNEWEFYIQTEHHPEHLEWQQLGLCVHERVHDEEGAQGTK